MRTVIDVGCMTYPEHPEDESVLTLIKRFEPQTLIGFDPNPRLVEGVEKVGTTTVYRHRAAAWKHDGLVTFTHAPEVLNDLRGHTLSGDEKVKCFDLALYLRGFPSKVILKLDCEGAEHVLVPHLIETGAIEQVELLLVEVHGTKQLPPIPVPWEHWV